MRASRISWMLVILIAVLTASLVGVMLSGKLVYVIFHGLVVITVLYLLYKKKF